jgi:hypothetical protein
MILAGLANNDVTILGDSCNLNMSFPHSIIWQHFISFKAAKISPVYAGSRQDTPDETIFFSRSILT